MMMMMVMMKSAGEAARPLQCFHPEAHSQKTAATHTTQIRDDGENTLGLNYQSNVETSVDICVVFVCFTCVTSLSVFCSAAVCVLRIFTSDSS